MKSYVRIILCSGILSLGLSERLRADQVTAPAPPQPTEAKATGKAKTTPKKGKTNASGLLGDMEKAVAYILKEAQPAAAPDKAAPATGKSGAKPNPKKKMQRPFWSGLKTINSNIDEMKKAVAAKDPKFFQLLDTTGSAVAQVNGAAQVMRLQDKEVLGGLKGLTIAYHALRENFGKEAARKKKGGELTAKEKEQMGKMQAEVKKLETELQKMEEKVKAKKDPRLLAQVSDLKKRAAAVAGAKGAGLNAYLELLDLLDFLSDEWDAFGKVVQFYEPDLYLIWTASESILDPYFDYYETAYAGIEITDWAYLEVSIEVVDVEETYDLEITATEISNTDTWVESYTETSATEEATAEETAADDADTSTHEDEYYDPAEDEDGDGLEDGEDLDDDGDGAPDATDGDDDNDGVPDAEDSDDGADDADDSAADSDDGGDDGGEDDSGDGDDGGGEEE